MKKSNRFILGIARGIVGVTSTIVCAGTAVFALLVSFHGMNWATGGEMSDFWLFNAGGPISLVNHFIADNLIASFIILVTAFTFGSKLDEIASAIGFRISDLDWQSMTRRSDY